MHCLSCKYPLKDSKDSCPECGLKFDFSDARTYIPNVSDDDFIKGCNIASNDIETAIAIRNALAFMGGQPANTLPHFATLSSATKMRPLDSINLAEFIQDLEDILECEIANDRIPDYSGDNWNIRTVCDFTTYVIKACSAR